MRTRKNIIKNSLLLLLLLFSNGLWAQEVSGVVKNNDNKPLMGYVVTNTNTGEVSITDNQGMFTLDAKAGDLLQVSYLKRQLASQQVDGESLIFSIYSNPFSKEIQGAYGPVNGLNTTAAIDMIGAEDIENNSFTNTHHALIGKLASLTTVQSSGEPGSNGLRFYVRGKSSYAANTPLVLVDGFESDFAHLSSREIESITVLKDAVATAMYGMRGANGVIVVTTKKGEKGKTKFRISGDYGILQPVNLPQYVESYDYARMVNEAHANEGLAPRYSQTELDGYMANNDPYNYPNVDWQEEMLKNASSLTNTTMEIQGGSDRVTYYTMLGFMSAGGFFKHTEENPLYSAQNSFDRFNFRTNANIELNKRTRLITGIGGRIENRDDPQVGTGTLFTDIIETPANRYVLYNENETWGGDNFYRNNPMARLVGKGNTEKHTRAINFNTRLNHEMDYLTQGLSASAEMYFYNNFNVSEKYTASYEVQERHEAEDGSISYTPYGQTKAYAYDSRATSQNRSQTMRFYLNYDRTFGDHAFNGAIVAERQQLIDGNDAEAYLFQGISGRLNYAYQNKYFVDVVTAYNGTNSYNPDHQYGIFPALGLGWQMSNEAFMQDIEWIDYLKVRSSYGMVGNSLLDGYRRFMYLETYAGTGDTKYKYGTDTKLNLSGLSERDIANPDAEWEKGYQFNAGLDAVLFERLSVSLDYFNERRADILQSIDSQVSDMIGITMPRLNYGEVKNHGFDITATYKSNTSVDFSWYVSANAGFARNEITQYYELTNAVNSKIGSSINTIFGYTANGFYATDAEAAASTNTMINGLQAGDIIYNDTNNDGKVNNYDQSNLGVSFPEMHYGITLGAEYKGFYATAQIDGNALFDVNMKDSRVYSPLGSGYANISEYAAAKHWTSARGNSAELPRLGLGDNYNNSLTSTLYLRDGGFMRLRTAELGYQLPKEWISELRMESAKLYVRGHNLLSLNGMDADIDPEVRSGFPLLKSYTVGVNIQF